MDAKTVVNFAGGTVLGWFTNWRFGVTACFDNQLDDKGACGSGSIPPGDVPGNVRWLADDVAIGGQGLSVGSQPNDIKPDFAPPMDVREFCVTCAIAKAVIVILAIFGLWALLT